MSKTMIADFTKGSVAKKMLLFSAPLFLSNLLQIVYNMVDMVIVGIKLHDVGLSAVSVGGDVSSFLTFIAIGFSNAGQVIISQYIGANKKDSLSKFIKTMTTFLLLCALVLSVICTVLREPIIKLMNAPDESYNEALNYATVCMVGMVFIYGYNIVGAILRGMGDSKHPFIFISIAAILNVLLDLLFVLVLDMRAMGAAIATVISQAVSFVACAAFLLKNKRKFELNINLKNFLFIDKSMLMALIKLGIPMAIKNASVQFSKLFVNSWINSYGIIVSAVSGVANKFNSICSLFSNAVNTAGSSFVGQNIGAEKYKRVPRIILTSFTITLIVSLFLSAAVLAFPDQIFGLFNIKGEEALEVAYEFIPIAILLFFGSTFRTPLNSFINGSGNYKVNFATAFLDGFVMRIGLALLFGLVLDMKHVGFWLGDALAGFTPFIIGGIFYLSGKWKTNKYILKK